MTQDERYDAIIEALSRDPLMERAELEDLLGCSYVTIFKAITGAGESLKSLKRQAVEDLQTRLAEAEARLAELGEEISPLDITDISEIPPHTSAIYKRRRAKAKSQNCAYYIGKERAYCGEKIIGRSNYCAEHDHKINFPVVSAWEYERSKKLRER